MTGDLFSTLDSAPSSCPDIGNWSSQLCKCLIGVISAWQVGCCGLGFRARNPY